MNGIVDIRGKRYATVAYRIGLFRESFAAADGWAVTTEIVHRDAEEVVMRAMITDPTGRIVATGYAEEKRGGRGINSTAALENCETSAVGRALAFLGLGGDEIASADEVAAKLAGRQTADDIAATRKREAPADTAKRRAGHDPEWEAGGRERFMAALSSVEPATTYDQVRAWCEAHGRGKPSTWPADRRKKLLDWLGAGHAVEVHEWAARGDS